MRLFSFDALKLLAIFLVLWGHAEQHFLSTEPCQSPVYRVIYAFHMPLFMMLSGYFAVSSLRLNMKMFFIKKFRQLIYPILVWGAVLGLFLEATHDFHFGHPSFSVSGLLADYLLFTDFWFLKSLFVCYTIAFLGCKTGLRMRYWMPLTFLLSQAIAPLQVSFMYPAFLLGIILRSNPSLLSRLVVWRWVLAVLFVLMLCGWSEEAWRQSHGLPAGLLHAGPLLCAKVAAARCFRLLIGLVGSVTMIAVFQRLLGSDRQSERLQASYPVLGKVLQEWGRYTMEIYILQVLVLEGALACILSFDEVCPFIFHFLLAPGIALLVLAFIVGFVRWVYRYRRLGLLLFGK